MAAEFWDGWDHEEIARVGTQAAITYPIFRVHSRSGSGNTYYRVGDQYFTPLQMQHIATIVAADDRAMHEKSVDRIQMEAELEKLKKARGG